MPNKKTFHSGASEERHKILKKVKRLRTWLTPKKAEPSSGYKKMLELEQWLMARVKRFRARKGGL